VPEQEVFVLRISGAAELLMVPATHAYGHKSYPRKYDVLAWLRRSHVDIKRAVSGSSITGGGNSSKSNPLGFRKQVLKVPSR
jgi:hypothetical protein